NALGADVIITDHHVPGPELPPALTVVDPHFLHSGHPLENLTGVGVAYELALALDPASASNVLDLVALGTVADVGTLTGDNRYLVQLGLEALRRTQRPGLLAIYQAANLRAEGLTEEHIGFVLAPRLNALGRLADAAHGVELLTTTDHLRARTLATEVEGLNAKRQMLTKQITEAALAQVETEPALLREHQALVLSHPTWPGGSVGIVAGRLTERFAKPTVLITSPEGQPARGSGRSIPGIDLMAALDECADLLNSYGGHPGAAGFSLDAEQIPRFRTALSRAVAAQKPDLLEPTLNIDAYVELPDLTLDLVADLNRLAPFGPGNPALTLAVRDLGTVSKAPIGRTGEHIRVTVEDAQARTGTVFWWHGADGPLPAGRFDLALTVRANDFRGLTQIQLDWLDARELEPGTIQVQPVPAINVVDYRMVPNPEAVLQTLLNGGHVEVWAEAEHATKVSGSTRHALSRAPALAIWTLPPGPHELRAALAAVEPETVYLFGLDPGMDEARGFLTRLAGMAMYALHHKGGQVDLALAAARTAQREQTIQAGLEYLAARGQVSIAARGETWQLEPGAEQPDPTG
ncbi:MAG: single-stranded-DNA-specific exonuclease RecJ, partial [Anaerolineae bacterium]